MARPTTAIITVLILAVLFLVFDLHQKTKQNLNYQAKFFQYSIKGSWDELGRHENVLIQIRHEVMASREMWRHSLRLGFQESEVKGKAK